jgi:hypothetical protein
MKRFKNIPELLKAFRQGDITAGRTSSVCSNYSTDFKKQPKYYFINDIYFENGKATHFINRTLKTEIILCDYDGSCHINNIKDDWTIILVSDHAYIREYIRTHTQNAVTFNMAVRFCLTNSYINDFINIKNSIKNVRCRAYSLLWRYYELRKNYQNARKYLNKKCKKADVPALDTFANNEFAISNWKGWRKYWTYYKYNGTIAYADLSLRLSKDEILTLIRKTFYYNPVRLSHHISAYMPYDYFMKFYGDLAHLKHAIEDLNTCIKGASLTHYMQWNGREIEYIAKIIKKYGLPI